jgi:iron(III) transport system permease protein
VSHSAAVEVSAPQGAGTSGVDVNGRIGSSPPLWLVVASVGAIALVSIPLVYLVVRGSGITGEALVGILTGPRVGPLALNTLALGVAVTTSSLFLGTVIAALISRLRIGATRMWLLLSALPLAVPSYLASYGWLVLVPGLNGFWPSFALLTAVTMPYVILPVAAALRGTSADGEAVARTLGRGPVSAFWSVTWPQVRPAAIAGALLVFLYTLSDFGLVAMLRFQTLTWGIQQAYAASFDRSQAAVLALLLVVMALAVVGAERSARGQVDSSVATHLALEPIRPALRVLVASLIATPIVIGVVVPLVGLGMRLLQAETLAALNVARLATATGNTIGVSLGAAVLALLLALPIAALAARYSSRWVGALESMGYLSNALPGIVVGLSLVFFSLQVLPGLYQTLVVLVFAYAVLFMPKALGTARSSIENVSPELVSVARTLGASPFQAWYRVTVPLALPGLGIGALLVAITTMKELPATLLLRPTGFDTLATELWSKTAAAEFGAAAPYAAVLVLVAAIPAMILSGVGSVAKEEL